MKDARTMPAMGPMKWTLMLVLSLLWGGSFFFYKVLVAQVPPLTVVLGRVGLAALMLHLLLVVRRDPMPREPALWGRFIILGVLNNVVPFTLFAFGETRISSGLASILNATTPLFGVIVAHLFTVDERLSWGKAAGVAFGLAGVAVLIGPDALLHAGSGDLLGEGACLGAACTYALASLYGRRFRALPPLKVATGQVTGSTLVLIPLSALIDRPWNLPMPDATVCLAFVGIALLSTALAYVIFFRVLAVAGATNLLFVTFLLPISALALGVAFLGETISVRAVLGMALIGLGLVALDGRLVRRLSR